jgi:general L-amino acid transport system permease protein
MSDIASDPSIAFVRYDEAERLPPPVRQSGPIGWLRANLFSSPGNIAITIVFLVLVAWMLSGIIQWAFIDAVWTGEDREACLGPEVGACWAYVRAKFWSFIYGRYPFDERWRVDLTLLLFLAGFVPMLIPKVPFKRENIFYLLVVFPIIAFILLTGKLGLEPVPTSAWGGLMLTLVVAIVGITGSLPLGILLALGRRSKMPIVRYFCIGFIEIWRGVPMVTVLFMANVMLPLFLPPGTNFDRLLRALVGVTMFASAYMAEIVRGGLQAIPRGQYEAAAAMGLGYWKMMRLIILPQALKIVIPGIVNNFISLFKDTTLVVFVGLFDLLGMVQVSLDDQNWATPYTAATGFVFAAMIFWIFCFGMSRYSMFIERRLNTGHRR